MFNLTNNCQVNRSISKKVIYEKFKISNSIKNEFFNIVDKIVWLYKLSESTLGLSKTDKVEEIQIFELSLKEMKIPKNVIKVISDAIPYKILFVIKYKEEFCYGVEVGEVYFTNWNELVEFDFNGLNLETVFENIVKVIIKENNTNKDFNSLIQDKNRESELNKKIEQLRNKMRQERQFDKKVELNKCIKELEKEKELLLK